MGYGLAALAGIGQGTGGLLQGMLAGDQFAMEQARLAEQKRQFDESRFVDPGTLDALKSAGLDLGIAPGTRMQTSVLPIVLQQKATEMERQRKAALAQDVSRQLIDSGTSIGLKPDVTLGMPQPGQVAPARPAPASSIAQMQVDPQMARLASIVPSLLQVDPSAVTALLKEQFTPEKGVVVGENATLRNPRTGAPIGPSPAASPIPEGFVPTRMTRGGVTYESPTGAEQGKTLEERVTAAQMRYQAEPTEANRLAMEAANNAWKLFKEGHPGTNVNVNLPKPADPEQIRRDTDIKSALGRVQQLAQMARQLEQNPGLMTHLIQTVGPTLENRAHIAALSPFERQFLALYDITQPTYIAALQSSTIGRNPAAYKKMEAAFGEPFGVGFADRMQMAAGILQTELQNMAGSMEQANRIPFNPPSATVPPNPADKNVPAWRQQLGKIIKPFAGAPATPPAAPTPQAPQSPIAQRYKQLRDSGLTKEQAGTQLKKEGYALP